MRNLTDEELVRFILNTSETKYINLLHARYKERINTTCLFWLKDPELAADCTQDVFVKLFQKLGTFNNQSAFSTWVTAIARNYCTDKLRQQKRQPLHLSLDENRTAADLLGLSEVPHEVIDVTPYFQRLKLEDQQILHLKYEQEVKLEDLAVHLGITLSAVKMRLKRARTRLKDIYDQSDASRL
ncbi:MAG: sigma-70 family RNA polymerase sigma factor [Cytophagales bacterium]|nr:MAG: sigma-70 family RNA polymerase sigma factor [Cytophagales bacterium]